MIHQEIEQELKFYENNENLQQVEQRLNKQYRRIRNAIALEYIEIISNIEDEDEKSKIIEMLQKRRLYPVKQKDGKYSLPECEDVVKFDEEFESDIAYNFYDNKVSFEEFVKALLPHESIHQWTLGAHNSIEFIDEGLVESEARRISDKYSIDSLPLRMTEVNAVTPLVTNMIHNQKIQMMISSSYDENFRQYSLILTLLTNILIKVILIVHFY